MHRSLVLYLPPEDPQAFREYYESTHIPLFKSVPGLRAFRYSFNVSAPEGESPYVAVSEAEWDDAQAYGRKSLADIRKYATGGAVVVDYPIEEA
jgi:uncharacterized protein (TIGR02118 family)